MPEVASVGSVMSMDDAATMAMALPDVIEGVRHGHRSWSVKGKGFAWERPFHKADIKRFGDEPVPAGPILAVHTVDLSDKEAVLAEAAKGVFTITHFNNYPAVLIQLDVASKRVVRELIVDGWLACAPRQMADEYVARSRSRR